MSSFSIINTNVSLTTNVKIIVDSNYNMYIDSINSDSVLSIDKYKKFKFNKDSKYDVILHKYWDGLNNNYVYKVNNIDDQSIMYNDFSNQFDDLYNYGSRYITNNKSYDENFEFFAPLYIDKESIPEYFLIFKIDGPGLIDLNSDNFNDEYIKKLKCIKHYSLKDDSNLGYWLNSNFKNNEDFKDTSLDFDFRKDELIKWYGIDYINGGYVNKSLFSNDILSKEHLYKDLNKLVTDGYKLNSLVYPNILNLTFLFDDIKGLDKWNINRYTGFYIDKLEKYKSYTLFNTYSIKNDYVYYIDNDNYIFTIIDNVSVYNVDPFEFGYNKDESYYDYIYSEYNGVYYKIERVKFILSYDSVIRTEQNNGLFFEDNGIIYSYKYKIISNIILSDLLFNDFNKNTINIDITTNEISFLNNDPIISLVEYNTCDIWVINIDGILHNVIGYLVDNIFKTFLYTDYKFIKDIEKVIYYIGDDYQKSNNVNYINLVVNSNNKPKSINLYKCILSDIKSFDYDLIDTNYSKYEYEYDDKLSITDETKMYMENLNSSSFPKDIDDYIFNGDVVNIPVSSEYLSSNELFSIENENLNDLWKKNPINIKWGYHNSISSNDYPYLLNINNNSEDYNRTCSLDSYYPNHNDRNLDYFYSIRNNNFIENYDFQTLNINNEIFNINDYINSKDVDYFSKLFRNSIYFNSKKVNYYKYSKFIYSDGSITNSTLFRGIKFNIFKVENVKYENGYISNISYRLTNKFNDYKFSILLSKNDTTIFKESIGDSIGLTSSSVGSYNWKIINKIGYKNIITNGELFISNDILYKYVGIDDINIEDYVDIKLISSNGFEFYNSSIVNGYVFWDPLKIDYIDGDYVYNNSEYYIRKSSGNIDFWNPLNTSYVLNDIVYYKDTFYKYINSLSITENESCIEPNISYLWEVYENAYNLSNFKWQIVEIWDPTYSYESSTTTGDYIKNNYVYDDGKLYKNLIINSGDINNNMVGDVESWEIIYDMKSDTNRIYNSGILNNNIFIFNDVYYLCIDNIYNKTLDNGIVVYINNIFKNVLINIYINDDTYDDEVCAERYNLYYNKIYSKLTSTNIVNTINNINEYGGYSDSVKYVIIDVDDVKVYDNNNMDKLPYIINCDVSPDILKVKTGSILYEPINVQSNILKSFTQLENGEISSLDLLNWYDSSIPLSSKITYKEIFDDNIINYHGMSKNIYSCIYRYSGYYSPIFKNINLFNTNDNYNYRFDTNLYNFGIIENVLSSKVNRDENILRLKDNLDYKSIYPMINEYGYLFLNRFIFKSNWDFKYYIETKR